MPTRTTALIVALLAGVAACRNRDPELRDTGLTTVAKIASDTASAIAGSDSAFVPNDQPVTRVAEVRSDTATMRDTTPKPVVKAPVKSKPVAPKPVVVPVDSTPKTTTTSPSTVTDAPVNTPAPVTPPGPVQPAPAPARDSIVATKLPFAPGERLEYQVKFGSISVGKAVLEVIGIDTVRGIPALHIRLRVDGKLAFFSVKDRYESWIDTRTMSSLRYTQDIDEATYERERHYEIYPERKTYHERGKKELPSVAAPLDDASFLFFLRTIPLVVGQTSSFDRYFKPDRNPVKAVVMRRERITVPAGKFETIVVRPIIKTSGLFSEGGRAEVWFADDESRILVQLKTQMKVGSLNLFLRKVQRAPAGS